MIADAYAVDKVSASEPAVMLRRMQADSLVRIGRALRQLDDHLAALLGREGITDITPRQSHVLLVLYHAKEPMPARRIAEALGISEVTCGRFVHALAGAGWVERRRDPGDGRTVLVSLTPKTEAAVPAFLRVSNAALDAMFAGISADELAQFAALVDRIADNLAAASP